MPLNHAHRFLPVLSALYGKRKLSLRRYCPLTTFLLGAGSLPVASSLSLVSRWRILVVPSLSSRHPRLDRQLLAVAEHTLWAAVGADYHDALGKQGAEGNMTFVMIVQFMMGLSMVVATSRQAWAFSRDGALRMIWACMMVSLIIFDNGAFVSHRCCGGIRVVCFIDLRMQLGVHHPIIARVVWGEARFTPSPLYTGKFSKMIAWVSIVYMVFAIILTCFSTGGPNPTSSDMN